MKGTTKSRSCSCRDFQNTIGERRRDFVRAEFIGERMNEAKVGVKYQSVKIGYKNKSGKSVHFKPKMGPGFSAKQGAGRLRQAAEGFANEIAILIRRNRIDGKKQDA
jgi:hypothetical protein